VAESRTDHGSHVKDMLSSNWGCVHCLKRDWMQPSVDQKSSKGLPWYRCL